MRRICLQRRAAGCSWIEAIGRLADAVNTTTGPRPGNRANAFRCYSKRLEWMIRFPPPVRSRQKGLDSHQFAGVLGLAVELTGAAAKLQSDERQAYATFGLLRSTLPAHCGEAALLVILHRRTHANERTSKTGQTSSSFGFIGGQIAVSANEPVEDMP